jgi:hypothetical protein
VSVHFWGWISHEGAWSSNRPLMMSHHDENEEL